MSIKPHEPRTKPFKIQGIQGQGGEQGDAGWGWAQVSLTPRRETFLKLISATLQKTPVPSESKTIIIVYLL